MGPPVDRRRSGRRRTTVAAATAAGCAATTAASAATHTDAARHPWAFVGGVTIRIGAGRTGDGDQRRRITVTTRP